ncbi:MAG: FKBP-type peptidyl-prolyl cis-trans isomerase [Euryarchaeota archaeon]|nr:FKBP-type peptidyl-prolyl cis-trans isomerase [Euryarchaeota archaeon]
MTSFSPDMQNEKLAAILLVIVIVGSISVFLTVTYGEDILNTLTGKKTGEKVIAFGDCADVNFIGRYASNNTIFDSSYNDTTTKTGGTPLNIFVTLNQSEYPPDGYDVYSSSYIEGLMEGLVGLKEGQTSEINITPAKAYGAKKLKVGDTFSTKSLTYSDLNYQLNQTSEVFDLTDENITLKWLNVQGLGNFTLPEAILMGSEDIEQTQPQFPYDTLPPYYIWENSSMIINVTDTNVLIKTTPTKTQNLTKQVTIFGIADKFGFIFPDATTAEWNESKITIQSSPIPGSNYKLDYGGMLFNITVNNITTTHVNVSIEFQGESQYYDLNRTIEFNRTYSMHRIYKIPLTYFQYFFGNDIQKAGYGLSKLAGEQLLFEVTILKVYKTS